MNVLKICFSTLFSRTRTNMKWYNFNSKMPKLLFKQWRINNLNSKLKIWVFMNALLFLYTFFSSLQQFSVLLCSVFYTLQIAPSHLSILCIYDKQVLAESLLISLFCHNCHCYYHRYIYLFGVCVYFAFVFHNTLIKHYHIILSYLVKILSTSMDPTSSQRGSPLEEDYSPLLLRGWPRCAAWNLEMLG